MVMGQPGTFGADLGADRLKLVDEYWNDYTTSFWTGGNVRNGIKAGMRGAGPEQDTDFLQYAWDYCCFTVFTFASAAGKTSASGDLQGKTGTVQLYNGSGWITLCSSNATARYSNNADVNYASAGNCTTVVLKRSGADIIYYTYAVGSGVTEGDGGNSYSNSPSGDNATTITAPTELRLRCDGDSGSWVGDIQRADSYAGISPIAFYRYKLGSERKEF